MKNFCFRNKENVLNLQFDKYFNMKKYFNMEKMFKTFFLAALFSFTTFTTINVNASHIMGADITYKCTDTNVGKYKFTVSLYRDCSGIFFGGEQLQIRKQGVSTAIALNSLGGKDVTPICYPPDVPTKPITNCPNGPIGSNGIKGVERYIWEVEYVVGKNIGFAYFAWTSCCRNGAINTIAGASAANMWVQCLINTKAGIFNNSVVFTTPPVPYWCRLKQSTYAHGAVDSFDSKYILLSNGKQVVRDSISYQLYTPFNAEAANPNVAANLGNPGVTFNTPLNQTNFCYTTTGVTVNPITGTITCTPSIVQDAIMAMAVKEWRAEPNSTGGYTRVLAGYVCRDIQFTVRDLCPPISQYGVLEDSLRSANKIAFNVVDVCGSKYTKISFKIIGAFDQFMKTKIWRSPDSSSVKNFKYKEVIVRANQVDTIFGTITFDSTVGIGSDIFEIEAFYCTSIGIKQSDFYTLLINYRTSVYTHKDFLYYCTGGKPVRSIAKGGTKYRWTPTKNIVAAATDSSWVDIAPDSTRTYVVKAIDGIDSTVSCTLVDSVRVIVIPKFNYTLSPKVSNICLHDTVQVLLNTQISDTPYTYTWYDPTIGSMFNPTNNKKTTSISSPRIIAINDAKYKVDIENRFGCQLTDSIQVNLKGVRPNANAISARSLVCPGDTTLVSVKVIPKTCGPSLYSCVGTPQTVTIQAGAPQNYPTTCNAGVPATCYPNPFTTVGPGQASSTRIIYKKAELIAAGIKPGIIKSIAFNISNVVNSSFSSYEVRIGATTSINAITANAPMFTIFGPAPLVVAGGWHTSTKYPITRGFDWDGNSNIIIETHAVTTLPVGSSNQMLTMTSIAGNEVAYKYSDTIGLSAENSAKGYTGAGASAAKPQLQVEFCTVDSTPTNILNAVWIPTNLISNISNPRAIATISQKDSLFTATVGTTQCFDTAQVKVKIDNTFKVTINPGKRIYCITVGSPPNVPLSATVTGGAGTTIKWTCLQGATAGGLTTDNVASITVVPTTVGTFKYVISAADLPCSATDTVTITVNNTIPVSLVIDSPLCTSNTGKLKAILPGGTTSADYKFNWAGAASPFIVAADTARDSLKNLPSGNYTLMIQLKADLACQGTTAATLSPKIITLNVSDTTSGINCNGGTADSLWARVSSPFGSGNYKYIWTPGTAGDTFYKMTNKLAGNYTTNVVDRITGCTGSTAYIHSEPTPLTVTMTRIKHVFCKGMNTGEIDVIASGGTLNGGSYIYQWASIEKGQVIPNFNQLVQLYADSIRVTVTDINGCTVSAGYRIIEPLKGLQIDSMRSVGISAINVCDGTATAYISGGTPNYTYTWSWLNPTAGGTANGPKSATFDALGGRCKGMNYVTVTDAQGCTRNDSVFVKGVVCNMKYFVKTDSVLCAGQSTGKIHFGAIDSLNYPTTISYVYTLYNGYSTASVDSIDNIQKTNHYLAVPNADTAHFITKPFGSYTVRIRTSKGCDTAVNFIDIGQNPAINPEAIGTMPSCFGLNDGEVHVKINSGGVKPFTYDYGSGFVTDSFNKTQTHGIGKTVIVKDALGCTMPAGYNVDTPVSITVTVNPNPVVTNCRGDATGTAVINVTSSTPSVLATVSYMSKPGSNVDTTSNQLTGLNAGTKTFIVEYTNSANGNRCPFPYSFTVLSPDTLVVTPTLVDPTCHYNFDGKIIGNLLLDSSGTTVNNNDYGYDLYKGSTLIQSLTNQPKTIQFNNLDSGIYKLTVYDSKGCSNTQTVTLNKPDTFRIGFTGIVDASCITSNNGEINISSFTGGNTTAPGAYGIAWSRIDLLAGNNIDIPQPQYTNNSNPKTLIGLSTYTAIATDSKGCTASRSTTIDTQYVLRITKLTVDSAKCYGSSDGKITINSVAPSTAPGLTYAFSSPNSVANVLTEKAGNYTVTVNDAVGCVTTGSATIEQPTDITILGKVYDAKCYGEPDGRIKIKVSGGTLAYKTIVWGSGANQQFTDSATNLPAGDHTVTVTDAHNCPKQQTFTVLQPVEFKVSIDSKKDISCYAAADGEIKLKTSGGVEDFSYVWNNSLPATKNQINLGPNTYRVTATDATGCTTTASQQITEPLKLEFDPIKVDSVSCPGYNDGVIDISPKGGTITALKGYEFSIDGGLTFVSGNKFTGLYAKDYNVALRDNNGCIASRRVTVYQPETLFITAKRDTLHDTLTMGQTAELSFTKSNNAIYISNISWTPSAALSCADCARPIATPYITTLYEVEVRYTNNCIVKSKINVPVYDPLDFFVPSAFTPGNGDGLNDQLMVFGNGVKKSRLMIFNRWGEKVFESDHITKGWDGKFKGESQPSGVYSFHAEVEYLNGEKRTKKGSLTLIR